LNKCPRRLPRAAQARVNFQCLGRCSLGGRACAQGSLQGRRKARTGGFSPGLSDKRSRACAPVGAYCQVRLGLRGAVEQEVHIHSCESSSHPVENPQTTSHLRLSRLLISRDVPLRDRTYSVAEACPPHCAHVEVNNKVRDWCSFFICALKASLVRLCRSLLQGPERAKTKASSFRSWRQTLASRAHR
jgi:hypothetical protein